MISQTPPELRELRRYLLRQAEHGIAIEQRDRVTQELRTQLAKISAAGFNTFEHISTSQATTSIAFLQTHYVLMQYERLIEGEQESLS